YPQSYMCCSVCSGAFEYLRPVGDTETAFLLRVARSLLLITLILISPLIATSTRQIRRWGQVHRDVGQRQHECARSEDRLAPGSTITSYRRSGSHQAFPRIP